jgi:hypothetical protein
LCSAITEQPTACDPTFNWEQEDATIQMFRIQKSHIANGTPHCQKKVMCHIEVDFSLTLSQNTTRKWLFHLHILLLFGFCKAKSGDA